MKTVIAAIHGILTRQTDASWPDQFDAWLYQRDPAVKVLKKEYVAGPFPRWNCWIKDPLLARGLASELELFLNAQPSTPNPQPSVWLVAHSNGAVIALLAARRLIARGHRLGGLILTGAACQADVARNGVFEWWSGGMVGAAIAYSSPDDAVLGNGVASPRTSHFRLRTFPGWLWRKLIWPYGTLGRTGWVFPSTLDPRPSAIFTRWFPGGHGTYFAPANIERTFERIYRDVKSLEALEPDNPAQRARQESPVRRMERN